MYATSNGEYDVSTGAMGVVKIRLDYERQCFVAKKYYNGVYDRVVTKKCKSKSNESNASNGDGEESSDCSSSAGTARQQAFETEHSILIAAHSCPNIVQLLEARPNEFCLVLEFAGLGDLATFINHLEKRKKKVRYPEQIIEQVVKAVQFLHERDIVHYDIKCHNVLVYKTDKDVGIKVKLCDFSHAIELSRAEPCHDKEDYFSIDCMTTLFCAPPELLVHSLREADRPKQAYFAVDIWALGILDVCLRMNNTFGPFHSTGHSQNSRFETLINILAVLGTDSVYNEFAVPRFSPLDTTLAFSVPCSEHKGKVPPLSSFARKCLCLSPLARRLDLHNVIE